MRISRVEGLIRKPQGGALKNYPRQHEHVSQAAGLEDGTTHCNK